MAYLLGRHWAIDAEYRQKPNNLGIAEEDDAYMDKYRMPFRAQNKLLAKRAPMRSLIITDEEFVFAP